MATLDHSLQGARELALKKGSLGSVLRAELATASVPIVSNGARVTDREQEQ